MKNRMKVILNILHMIMWVLICGFIFYYAMEKNEIILSIVSVLFTMMFAGFVLEGLILLIKGDYEK